MTKAMDEARGKLDGFLQDFLAERRISSDGGYAPVEGEDLNLLSEIIGKLLDAKDGGQMPKALPEFKIGR